MLFVALAFMAQAAAPHSTMPSIGQPPEHCARQDRMVSATPREDGARKLNEMPNAEAEYAVIRKVDGCPIPVKVNAPRPRRR